MALINARDLLVFPQGDNSSDTLINGINWNLTTLQHWNYTYYSNGTFSNGSLCFLTFDPYTPHLLQNGTFLNSTSCYSPIRPLQARSIIGLAFASLFALSLVFSFANLRKHGRLFLPTEKRFRAVGRRWQWYWMVFVAAFAIISGITSVDVDRYYLPELPIVLTNFFWCLMLPTTMAVVWESVRHWGSWQERQMIDPNPFSLSQDDRRSKVELYLPLVFYLFFWMNIFMLLPRSWSALELQRDPNQARLKAEPVATDARVKASAFFLLTTNPKPTASSIARPPSSNTTPPKFLFTLPLSILMIAYSAACAFCFSISPLNYTPNLAIIYGLGWAPIALILAVYEIAGCYDPNEDAELGRQRRVRDAEADREMGITKKPDRWSRVHGDNRQLNVHDQVAKNVADIGGGARRTRSLERGIEMGNMPASRSREEMPDIHAVREASSLLSPHSPNEETQERFTDAPVTGRCEVSGRSDSPYSGTTLAAQPQQIRSMLDV
ncbi:Uncharacterized protein LSUE1_G001121 [Lachnellula suecica]|uniref:Uncharacterized protein n=1 Tax=Lachnellula suecica TaxID=602035 RepID=A0A8T9CLY2_9HELO|nr:Uncharacterized protein LSUE1_G001121 [Lachnellula suecica]